MKAEQINTILSIFSQSDWERDGSGCFSVYLLRQQMPQGCRKKHLHTFIIIR